MNWTETKYDGIVEWTADRDNLMFVIESTMPDEYIAGALTKITETTGSPFSTETFSSLEEAKEWCENVSFNWI